MRMSACFGAFLFSVKIGFFCPVAQSSIPALLCGIWTNQKQNHIQASESCADRLALSDSGVVP